MKSKEQKNNSKIIIAILIAVVILMGVKILIPVKTNSEKIGDVFKSEIKEELEDEALDIIDEIYNDDSIMDNYKINYIDGCMNDDANYEYCECTYIYMDSKWSNKKIIDESMKLISGEVSDDVIDLMFEEYVECGELLYE